MKLGTFLLISAVIYTIFGLGFLLIPGPYAGTLGLTLDEAGVVTARVLGSALISMALIFWWSRDAAYSDALQAVLRANMIYHLIDIPLDIVAIQSGIMSPVAWAVVVLHILLALGFAYFGFNRVKAALSGA